MTIEELAYSKWEQAGRPDGSGDFFWLEAEKELTQPEVDILTADEDGSTVYEPQDVQFSQLKGNTVAKTQKAKVELTVQVPTGTSRTKIEKTISTLLKGGSVPEGFRIGAPKANLGDDSANAASILPMKSELKVV